MPPAPSPSQSSPPFPIRRMALLLGCACLSHFGAPTASAAGGPFYWDDNGNAAVFGTAGGTWIAPILSQWSTSDTGILAPGASLTTDTTDTLNFGTGTAGKCPAVNQELHPHRTFPPMRSIEGDAQPTACYDTGDS